VLDLLEAGSRKPVQNFRLKNGATQVNVFVGVGSYITRLRLVGANGADLLPAARDAALRRDTL
jgi:galactose mutarotase-like enzyme